MHHATRARIQTEPKHARSAALRLTVDRIRRGLRLQPHLDRVCSRGKGESKEPRVNGCITTTAAGGSVGAARCGKRTAAGAGCGIATRRLPAQPELPLTKGVAHHGHRNAACKPVSQPGCTVSASVCPPSPGRAAAVLPVAFSGPAALQPGCRSRSRRQALTDCARKRVLCKLDEARGRGCDGRRRRCRRRRHYLGHCRHPDLFHSLAGRLLGVSRASRAGRGRSWRRRRRW